jgi:hypothetical protein
MIITKALRISETPMWSDALCTADPILHYVIKETLGKDRQHMSLQSILHKHNGYIHIYERAELYLSHVTITHTHFRRQNKQLVRTR